ncbi:MAG TPA: DUF255 domain-containing protein [Jatrophihabitans sp.]|nr:DUF255 domain-containing protein [Jatrophihabitans sp.]
MNRLGSSTSPYLRQHADNPVDWWEWSDEAFASARERDVPILLSVGYAACHWYRAHNASIVSGYLENQRLAEAESAPERFFMNVTLARVLYTHALVAAPRLALGRFAALGRILGDPRLGMAAVFLSLGRVLPDRYPLDNQVEAYIGDEHRFGRLIDYAVILPRLQRLYEWSADELGEPRLRGLIRDGSPIYVWHFEQRQVWRSAHLSVIGQMIRLLTEAR